jgi:hypothetical protein
MDAEYQNESRSKTIRYNYIDKENHLNVLLSLCMKSISYLKEQLLHGTMIKLPLKLHIPEWYQTKLSCCNVTDFQAYCNCCTKYEYVTQFLSFKGQIEIFIPDITGVYNTLFHITNTERLKLNTCLSKLRP